MQDPRYKHEYLDFSKKLQTVTDDGEITSKSILNKDGFWYGRRLGQSKWYDV